MTGSFVCKILLFLIAISWMEKRTFVCDGAHFSREWCIEPGQLCVINGVPCCGIKERCMPSDGNKATLTCHHNYDGALLEGRRCVAPGHHCKIKGIPCCIKKAKCLPTYANGVTFQCQRKTEPGPK